MKFSIHDILWLTILVAVAVTWWLDHRTGIRNQEQLRQQAYQLQNQSQFERAHRLLAETQAAVQREQAVLEAQLRERQLQAAKSEFENLASPSPE